MVFNRNYYYWPTIHWFLHILINLHINKKFLIGFYGSLELTFIKIRADKVATLAFCCNSYVRSHWYYKHRNRITQPNTLPTLYFIKFYISHTFCGRLIYTFLQHTVIGSATVVGVTLSSSNGLRIHTCIQECM